MSKCEYCDFKIKDYNDDYESTLGFNNRPNSFFRSSSNDAHPSHY